MDQIETRLRGIATSGKTEEIRGAANGFLQCLDEGSVGSNSVGLIYFLQEPQDYVSRFGDVIIGVI